MEQQQQNNNLIIIKSKKEIKSLPIELLVNIFKTASYACLNDFKICLKNKKMEKDDEKLKKYWRRFAKNILSSSGIVYSFVGENFKKMKTFIMSDIPSKFVELGETDDKQKDLQDPKSKIIKKLTIQLNKNKIQLEKNKKNKEQIKKIKETLEKIDLEIEATDQELEETNKLLIEANEFIGIEDINEGTSASAKKRGLKRKASSEPEWTCDICEMTMLRNSKGRHLDSIGHKELVNFHNSKKEAMIIPRTSPPLDK